MQNICKPAWRSEACAPTARAAIAVACLAFAPLASASDTRTVIIEAMQFSPAVMTVRQGDTVVWVNRDVVPHTATATPTFDSGAIGAGRSWKMVAKTKGRYDYGCTMHPSMKATLVVE